MLLHQLLIIVAVFLGFRTLLEKVFTMLKFGGPYVGGTFSF